MPEVKPGDTIPLRGREWYVQKTELRADGKWALLVIRVGSGKAERVVHRQWVHFDELGLGESPGKVHKHGEGDGSV